MLQDGKWFVPRGHGTLRGLSDRMYPRERRGQGLRDLPSADHNLSHTCHRFEGPSVLRGCFDERGRGRL